MKKLCLTLMIICIAFAIVGIFFFVYGIMNHERIAPIITIGLGTLTFVVNAFNFWWLSRRAI